MSQNHVKLNRRRWQMLRLKVFEQAHYRCSLCGKAGRLECDHVIPLHQGGETYLPENLQALCRACHIAKTRQENRKPVSPGVAAWRKFVDEL